MKDNCNPALCYLLLCVLLVFIGCSEESADPVVPVEVDESAPTSITDLAVSAYTHDSITLTWTATGDDSTRGQATAYDLRYTDEPDSSWEAWTPVIEPPLPAQADQTESFTVTELSPHTRYSFRITASDEENNTSTLSNHASAKTNTHGGVIYVNVDGSGTVATIPDALAIVQPGDEIILGPGTYTYSEHNCASTLAMVMIPRDMTGFTLRSEAGPGATILDGQNLGRVIFVQAYNDIIIDGFTITNGNAIDDDPTNAYGAGAGVCGHLTGRDVAFTIRNCIITNNEGYKGGGLWWCGISEIWVENCIIENNIAELGGGICLVNSGEFPSYFKDCVVRNNLARSQGGAVFSYQYSAEFERCVMVNNESLGAGGAVFSQSNPEGIPPVSYLYRNCTIAGNTAPTISGIMATVYSDIILQNTIVAFNTGSDGGICDVPDFQNCFPG